MKLFFRIIFLFIFASLGVNAKDIPENNDTSTYIDYENLGITKPLREDYDRKNKQVYRYDLEYYRFLLAKYLDDLPPPSSLDLKNIQALEEKREIEIKLAKEQYDIERNANPICFNLVDLQFQNQYSCPVTPVLKKQCVLSKPEQFNITNNLRRKTASPLYAAGEIIYVKGQLKDINCTPIQGAVINLWQRDGYGKYKTNAQSDKYFVGNGTAVTDNMGNYEFITVLPKSEDANQAPFLEVSVSHAEFGMVDTKIYFPDHHLNEIDADYLSLDKFHKTLITSELVPVKFDRYREGFFAAFDITLNGISGYRKL
jgi:protocatechuate 3,4-dioxygenase beta subunit